MLDLEPCDERWGRWYYALSYAVLNAIKTAAANDLYMYVIADAPQQ